MKNFAIAMVVMGTLSACADVGGDGDGSAPGAPPPLTNANVPEDIAGDLKAASFATAPDTLTVSITLDDGLVTAVYARNAIYDLPGYIAFTKQNDPLDRFFTGFTRQSADGSVQAVVVADGGQFTKFFGGATYAQTGTYSAPPAGLVSYAGTYVGLTNLPTRDGTLDAPSDTSPDIFPFRAIAVSGDVFLNASFATNAVNGAIYNRVFEDGSSSGLDTVFLIPAQIEADGSFAGTAEDREKVGIGSYAGTFGGVNASSVAGGVRLNGDFISTAEEEEETGIFVLGRCGAGGLPPICENVNDL